MLFSDKNLADYINKNYEPVWESARPVPLVTIDFGNGVVVNRTMQGNVVSYICFEDGRVIDVLPGLYEPTRYKQCLEALHERWSEMRIKPQSDRNKLVRKYHSDELMQIPAEEVLIPLTRLISKKLSRESEGTNRKNITAWTELYQDTIANEVVWRRTAHSALADMTPPLPQTINKRIYREVLHTDLDDPYLGMGPELFASYPFEK